jgi:WD40 repeat protein
VIQVLFSIWINPNNEMSKTDCQFVTGGNSLQFWKIEGAKLSKKNGRFGAKFKQVPLLSAANIQTKDGWRLICGTSTGDIYVFSTDKEVVNSFKAHEGPVLSLAESDNKDLCSFVVSGGRDRCVKVWNHSLSIISSHNVSEACAAMDGSVAALDVCPPNPAAGGSVDTRLRILAGTQGGDIFEIISIQREVAGLSATAAGGGAAAVKSIAADASGAVEDVRNKDLSGADVVPLLHSHSKGEQWGLACHPTDENIVATVGDDGALCIWHIGLRKRVAVANLQWPARSLTWHPSGHILCVGFHEAVKGGGGGSKGKKGGKGKAAAAGAGGEDAAAPQKEGSIALYTYHEVPTRGGTNVVHTLKKVASGVPSNVTNAWIADVKFSTDGSILAVGSHDKHMFVYKKLDQLAIKLDGKWPDFSHDDPVNWADTQQILMGKPSIDFNKHSSAVLHIDFSKDGMFTQTNCQAGELLFMKLADGKQEPSATKMADYQGKCRCFVLAYKVNPKN